MNDVSTKPNKDLECALGVPHMSKFIYLLGKANPRAQSMAEASNYPSKDSIRPFAHWISSFRFAADGIVQLSPCKSDRGPIHTAR